MNTFTQYAGRSTITDGAWGTQLHQQGLPPGYCPDLWNLENPSAVERVAASYVSAGSEIILTNTFRANRLSMAHWSKADQAAEIARAGAAISRRVAGRDVAVFGSIGPSGKILMMGDVSAEALEEAFAQQAAALAQGGADAILCESFTDLAEAVLAVKAAVTTGLAVVLSMSFDSGPDRTATMMGNTPAEVSKAAVAAGASAVGANCGAGPENYVKLTGLFRQACQLPIWVKPNAGLPVIRDGQTVFPMKADEFAGFAERLTQAGASFLGGCCGTTPEHIRALRQAVPAK